METFVKNNFSQNLIRILKGSLISIVITVFLLFLFAVLLTFTNISENIINPVVILVNAISILIGSSISTLNLKKNGLLNGGCIGIIYVLFIYLISSIIGIGFSNFNLTSVIMIIASIVAGMLGGIIGVNIK